MAAVIGLIIGTSQFGFYPSEVHSQEMQVVLEESLTDNTTIGKKHGGIFTAEGWKTRDRTDYIQYNIETISAGEIEFDVRGIYAANHVFPNLSYDDDGNVIPDAEDVHYSFFLHV